MADEILIESVSDQVLVETVTTELVEIATVGPQGPRGEKGESGASNWNDIAGKPSTFPPSAHTHVAADVSDFAAAVASVSPPVDWNSLTGKPSTFAPSAHKTSHATGGSDALTPADIGAVATNDARLSDSRTPTNHAASHEATGSDAIQTQFLNSLLGNSTLGEDLFYLDGIVSGLGTAATADSTDFAAASHTHSASAITDFNAAVTALVENEVRFDSNGNFTYTGQAAPNTSESTASWRIRRSEYTGAGSYVATLTANNVRWSDRLTSSYS